MEVRSLEKGDDYLKFMLGGSTPGYANTLRRLVVNRARTLAIEDVEIKTNNSSLYDEVLAHRLGLLPLKTDLSSYNEKDKCSCNGAGCAQCEVKLTLKGKGPGTLYASELKSQDPKIVPVYPETPIVKLQKEQEVELVATAVVGKGKDHAKWAPGHMWFTYKPNIKVNQNSKKFEEVKDKYPPRIFKNGKIDKNLINTPELVDACEGVCDDVVKIDYDDTSFIFHLENWGQLESKEMVKEAIETFNELIDDFSKQLKDLK
ncbi:MAG: DNA-directed RNA polymerase subunit D [Nanoarchaeota archaeon]